MALTPIFNQLLMIITIDKVSSSYYLKWAQKHQNKLA